MGRIAFNLYDIARALSCFHKVLNILDENENLELRSIVYAQIGYVYSKQNNLLLAQKYYQKAYHYSCQRKDTLGMLYGLRDMAMTYDYGGDKKKAIRTFVKATNLMGNVRVVKIKEDINLQIADCYLSVDEDSVYKYLHSSLTTSLSANAAYIAFSYYYLMNMDDSARYYLKQMLVHGQDIQTKYDACVRLTDLSLSCDDLQAAKVYFNMTLSYSDSLWLENQQEKEIKGKALYEYVYQTEQISKLEKSNKYKTVAILIALMIVVVVIALFVFYWQMTIVKKLQFQNKLKDWKLNASKLYHEKASYNNSIIDVIGLREYLLNGKHLPDELWKELEIEVDKYYKGFKGKLYSCCSLSEHEFHVCLLVKIGVGTSKISILTSRAPSTISTTKQRIYKKITHDNGTAEQFEKLLLSI